MATTRSHQSLPGQRHLNSEHGLLPLLTAPAVMHNDAANGQ